ncbi:hypothetical protein Pmar_PMAR017457 [Perkinsus marinus ATCC 50983]|uniref:Uncharacterized protein n=1 Tax=Perkinsus marinus (strain ATCC 50983 / TXsc) TaxID=423536 RepID=C5KG05_PERM5|nr:hypothetical protein Pmar_PMAR017457 [Perkinsus marinus ATCC 50983]EER16569.1 hypothetical protein Pmar_PMAR017457 [Perkinsus marinus ATCC 50983]|eukprot:XP_002784773.1 hypothetical protein Pmar_PMAR017457 [Perkinsus marinus ATCC 50983]
MFSLKRGEDEIGDEGVSPAELEWALAAHKLTAIKGVNLPCAVQELLVASSTATTVSSAIASQLEEPLNLKTPSVRLSMTVELEGIGLSLIDSTPEELLYFKTLLHTKTSNSTRHRAEDLLPISPEPSFQVGVVLMAGNEWRNIREIRSLNVTLQPLVINVDQKSFVRMLRFMMELYSLFEIVPASVARYVASVRTAGETDEQTVLGRSTARTSANSSMVAYHNMLGTPEFDASQRAPADSKVYIQTFTLDPVRVNLSLHTKSSRGRQGGKDDDVALVRLMNAAFENVPKVSNSPMRFKAITNEHSFATPAELASDIASFYVREGMMQFLKIIGSIDVLGNPVTFLNRVGDRIVDLLRDSTDATSRGDSHSLTTSLGRGVKSIGAGVVGGLFDSLSRMTSGLHASADAIIIYLQWIWIGEEELSDRRGCDMTCYEDTIEWFEALQLP